MYMYIVAGIADDISSQKIILSRMKTSFNLFAFCFTDDYQPCKAIISNKILH